MEQVLIIILSILFIPALIFVVKKYRDFKETKEAKRQARIEEKKQRFLERKNKNKKI